MQAMLMIINHYYYLKNFLPSTQHVSGSQNSLLAEEKWLFILQFLGPQLVRTNKK